MSAVAGGKKCLIGSERFELSPRIIVVWLCVHSRTMSVLCLDVFVVMIQQWKPTIFEGDLASLRVLDKEHIK